MEIVKNTILITSLLIVTVFACSPQSAELVNNYPIVYNTHDVKEIVSLYSEDVIFEIVGQFSLKGRNHIQGITEYDSVLHIQMSVSEIVTTGDTVFCNLSETNDWLKISGISETHYKVIFIFEDGLIKHFKAEATPETKQAFNRVLSPLMKWARKEKADLLAEMMPAGSYIYNAENAQKNLRLLRSWKDNF